MSTPAMHSIQSDAAKLARKIENAVYVEDPTYIDPLALIELASQLREIADRLLHHRTQTPEYRERLRKLAMGGHAESDPR